MGRIRVLPDIVANRIAAGEVVERPESIVKELIENALDAGAADIRIQLKNGGKSEIVVVDDGCGMGYDDAMLAFERHATSKIRSEQDLEGVATLGFRGEALPSIASISRLTVLTRTKEDTEGTLLRYEGGVLKHVSRAPADPGTRMEIRSLFFNVPARKKFLKTVETEYGRIVRVVQSYGLANPHTAFSLSHNGRQTLRFDSRQALPERVRSILGPGCATAVVDEGDVRIHVFLQPPEYNTRTSGKQFYLLNGRFIKDRTVGAAVMAAYRQVAGHVEGYPQVVLQMALDPRLVDVNVHPAKLEVRFRQQGRIFDAIKACCLQALSKRTDVPVVRYHAGRERLWLGAADNQVQETVAPTRGFSSHMAKGSAEASGMPFRHDEYESPGAHRGGDRPLTSGGFSVMGQFQASYIVAEREGALFIVDQHVAHERILYEEALRNLRAGGIQRSRLVVPETVALPAELLPVVSEQSNAIRVAGYRAEPVEERSVAITECPVFVPQGQIRDTFVELLTLLGRERQPEEEDLYRDVAALIGCKGAIKAGQSLGPAAMEQLLADLMTTEHPYYCPHGRPVILKLDLDEIEKLFKRK